VLNPRWGKPDNRISRLFIGAAESSAKTFSGQQKRLKEMSDPVRTERLSDERVNGQTTDDPNDAMREWKQK
jgi:hypothetical protein